MTRLMKFLLGILMALSIGLLLHAQGSNGPAINVPAITLDGLYRNSGMAQGPNGATILPEISSVWISSSTNYPIRISQQNVIIIYRSDGEELIRVNAETGELTYGKNYNPDLAARMFWEALGRQQCKDKHQQ
jgi:hypothetical protein